MLNEGNEDKKFIKGVFVHLNSTLKDVRNCGTLFFTIKFVIGWLDLQITALTHLHERTRICEMKDKKGKIKPSNIATHTHGGQSYIVCNIYI